MNEEHLSGESGSLESYVAVWGAALECPGLSPAPARFVSRLCLPNLSLGAASEPGSVLGA